MSGASEMMEEAECASAVEYWKWETDVIKPTFTLDSGCYSIFIKGY